MASLIEKHTTENFVGKPASAQVTTIIYVVHMQGLVIHITQKKIFL
jgi:hypothetical protein